MMSNDGSFRVIGVDVKTAEMLVDLVYRLEAATQSAHVVSFTVAL